MIIKWPLPFKKGGVEHDGHAHPQFKKPFGQNKVLLNSIPRKEVLKLDNVI